MVEECEWKGDSRRGTEKVSKSTEDASQTGPSEAHFNGTSRAQNALILCFRAVPVVDDDVSKSVFPTLIFEIDANKMAFEAAVDHQTPRNRLDDTNMFV